MVLRKELEAYLLILKITPKGDRNNTVVEVTDSKWNLILRELIAMSKIVERARQDDLLVAAR